VEEAAEALQAQLEAAMAAKEEVEQQLRASQQQTDSAVRQLCDAQQHLDDIQVQRCMACFIHKKSQACSSALYLHVTSISSKPGLSRQWSSSESAWCARSFAG
jgi:septal ring factor EnvC (AmiA/AmiB activator)